MQECELPYQTTARFEDSTERYEALSQSPNHALVSSESGRVKAF
jgi:hypothetical protein